MRYPGQEVIFSVDIPNDQARLLRERALDEDLVYVNIIRNGLVAYMTTHKPSEVHLTQPEKKFERTAIKLPDGLHTWTENFAAEVPCTVPELIRSAIIYLSTDPLES